MCCREIQAVHPSCVVENLRLYFFPLFLIPWLPLFSGPFLPLAAAAISLRAFSSGIAGACQ